MNSLLNQIWSKRFVFLGTFFLVFTFSYIFLLAIDFLPEPPAEQETVIEEDVDTPNVDQVDSSTAVNESTEIISVDNTEESLSADTIEVSEIPIQISIAKLGKTIAVLNPTSRTIADLDTALLSGVVRHPDSATLTQDGNVFILGHSSYLPTVFNKNFQAFNGIQNLEWGDIIEVSSVDSVYEYRVEKVYRASAQDLTVPIAGSEKLLTLATCNSFGSVDDRYVVEAKRVGLKNL